MSRTDPQLKFRVPVQLRDALEEAARENKRSLTAEITQRLELSFSPYADPEAVVKAYQQGQIDALDGEGDLGSLALRMTAAEEKLRRDQAETADMRETLDLLKLLGEMVRVGDPADVTEAVIRFQKSKAKDGE